jgi:hypothetical protein
MKLNELFESSVGGSNNQKTHEDQLLTLKIGDKRKPKITLKKLNSLRKLREFKRFEDLKNKSLVQKMYGSGGDDLGGF